MKTKTEIHETMILALGQETTRIKEKIKELEKKIHDIEINNDK